MAVDHQELPQAIYSTTGNVSACGAFSALLMLHADQFNLVQRVMVDGAIQEKFASLVANAVGGDVIFDKQNDLKNSEVTLLRWVIERSFGWLQKCRRLWKNCEREFHKSAMMVTLSFLRFMLKKH